MAPSKVRRLKAILIIVILGCLGGCLTMGSLKWDIQEGSPTGNVDDSSDVSDSET